MFLYWSVVGEEREDLKIKLLFACCVWAHCQWSKHWLDAGFFCKHVLWIHLCSFTVHRFACHESVGIASVAPFDTVLFPEKQETEMVVWCFSLEGQPSMCSLTHQIRHSSEPAFTVSWCFCEFLSDFVQMKQGSRTHVHSFLLGSGSSQVLLLCTNALHLTPGFHWSSSTRTLVKAYSFHPRPSSSFPCLLCQLRSRLQPTPSFLCLLLLLQFTFRDNVSPCITFLFWITPLCSPHCVLFNACNGFF